MNPPLASRWLLRAVAGKAEAEYVAGDLFEEYVCLCAEKGPRAGRRWYASQVVRSVASLVRLRLRRSGAPETMATSGLAAAWMLFTLDRLWSFVYSLVPLKDGLDRATGFLAFNVISVCAIVAVFGALSGGARKTAAIAAAMAAAGGISAWTSAGAAPMLYVLVLVTAPAASAFLAHACRPRALKRRLR